MPELMQWEEDVIINSMFRKSSKNIADTLGIDQAVVAEFIRQNSEGYELKSMDKILADQREKRAYKRPEKDLKPKKEKLKKDKPKITSVQLTYAAPRRIEKKYANREQHFSTLIPVKLDHKTCIYVKPGADIEAIKKQYIKIIQNSQPKK